MAYDNNPNAMREAIARDFHHEFGVPHARLRLRLDGFSVTFRRTSEYVFKMVHSVGDFNRRAADIPNPPQPNLGHLAAMIITILIMVALRVLTSGWWIIDRVLPTMIDVDPYAVTVQGRRMPREFFGEFMVHHTLTRGRKTVAVLGYGYGNRRYPFGGVWPEAKAEEVAAALNALLRLAPNAANEDRVDPDDLRNARPAQF